MDSKENKSPFVFARLSPHNIEAHQAFSNVVDTILNQPTQFEDHCKFLSYSPTQVPLHSVLSVSSTSSSAGTGTDTETEPTVGEDVRAKIMDQMIWKGCFTLSLDVLPSRPAFGWRAGSGRWKNDATGAVDLILTYSTLSDDVRGSHFWLSFNKNTGVLMLQPRHSGRNGIKLKAMYYAGQSNAQALIETASVIQAGRLEYKFEYTFQGHSAADKTFQLSKIKYFRDHLKAPPPIAATSITPSWNSMAIGPWTIPGTVGKGSYGVVSAAIHQNGTVVAVKSFLRFDRPTERSTMNEMVTAQTLMNHIQGQDNREYILQLKEVIFQRGASKFDRGPPEQVWMLYTPLAHCTFSPYCLSQRDDTISREARVALLEQVLKGVICLHAQNWVHRDLKPANLGVVSVEPPKAVILDLGLAHHIEASDIKVGIQPTPGQVGTVMYLAPEMELQPYNEKVDIWAFGLIALQLMTGFHPWKMAVNPWRPDTNVDYNHTLLYYHTHLRDWKRSAPDTVENLVSKLLEWDPKDRLSASEALQHPFFDTGHAKAPVSQEIETGKKRQRD